MRTTLDIDAQILRELKRIQKKKGTSLGGSYPTCWRKP